MIFQKLFVFVAPPASASSWLLGTPLHILLTCRDFPSTAVFIARQCGIVRNQRVDDIRDLAPVLTGPVRQYDPEDPHRIVKTIALAGKDLPEMTDAQWDQVCLSHPAYVSCASTKRLFLRGPRLNRNCG